MVTADILRILELSLLEMLAFVGPVLLLGLLLGSMEKHANKYWGKSLGKTALLMTAWIGVPVHETGHLLMCWLFRHKVTKVKLLDLRGKDGTLGYVKHTYNKKSLYQNMGNFFIGIGPLISANIFLILSMYMLLPGIFEDITGRMLLFSSSSALGSSGFEYVTGFLTGLLSGLFSLPNASNVNFWIYVFLSLGIASHMALSTADLKGATKGLPAIFLLLVIGNVLAYILKVNTEDMLARIFLYTMYLLIFTVLSVIFSAINTALAYLVYSFRNTFKV
ncbi:hypothetical protein [Methanolobus chelungpuianus]|uniref:Uncharacterized protein n=1 Tax=Methanolobus chelungpuianus TaxID=502115 RepID=A0AAE3KW86_9EURY|nr:hypothetical protein [Methanolobus chelungpuianus]MCQ6962300.1 hypothetical protein [Methanolobus chelungpuianus]